VDRPRIRAERHDERGEVDAAVAAWREATSDQPRDLAAHLCLVESLHRAGQLGEALDLARRLVAAAPGAAATHAVLSRARGLAGDATGAAESMAMAAHREPQSAPLRQAARRAARRAASAPEDDATVLALVAAHAERHGWGVLDGPFRGLQLVPPADARWGPLLWGIHEAELHPTVEEIVASEPSSVVNIGGAEGYYAVGLARRLPAATVVAFESDVTRRGTLAATAERNGVAHQVDVQGLCTVETLAAHLRPGAALVSDCEGAELWLLRPDRVPALRHCSMLIELHDFMFARISTLLARRFEATHDVTLIDAVDDRALPSDRRGLAPEDARRLLAEHRPRGMQWAWLRPRSTAP
jgi:hypothetical protein